MVCCCMGMPDLLGDWLICGVIMSRKNKKARWRECHWTGTEQLHTIPLDKPKKKGLEPLRVLRAAFRRFWVALDGG